MNAIILTMRTGAKQSVHWFLEDMGLDIQQRTSVWVGSPKSTISKYDTFIPLDI